MGTWEQQRANDLEAPQQREAQDATRKQAGRDELSRRNDRSVDAILRSTPTMKADTSGAGSGEVAALLAKHPTKTRGPDGYAAWLIEAHRLGFVDRAYFTNAQLQNLADDKPVRTWEYPQDNDVGPKAEKARKDATHGQLDNAHRVPRENAPGNKPREWDIDMKEAEILQPLVEVARTRITSWLTHGGPKKALSLGDFVRADMWYDSGEKAPPHEPGTAMDLGFVGRGARDTEVLELLQDLPPRGKLDVFLDNDGALHLDVRPGGYGLGIPSGPEFIHYDEVIDHDGTGVPTRNAEQAAGADRSGTLHATGIKRFSGVVWNGTAKWGVKDKQKNVEGWVWTWTATDKSMLPHITNTKLLNAINAYNSKKP